MGVKGSDYATAPLCFRCHSRVHQDPLSDHDQMKMWMTAARVLREYVEIILTGDSGMIP